MAKRIQKREDSPVMEGEDVERKLAEAFAECKLEAVSLKEVDYTKSKDDERKTAGACGMTVVKNERIQIPDDFVVIESKDVESRLVQSFAETCKSKHSSSQEIGHSRTKDEDVEINMAEALDETSTTAFVPQQEICYSKAVSNTVVSNIDFNVLTVCDESTNDQDIHAETRVDVSLNNSTSCTKSADVSSEEGIDRPNLGASFPKLQSNPNSVEDNSAVKDKKRRTYPEMDASWLNENNNARGIVKYKEMKDEYGTFCIPNFYVTEVVIDKDGKRHNNYSMPNLDFLRDVKDTRKKTDIRTNMNRVEIENPDVGPLRQVHVLENEEDNGNRLRNPDDGPVQLQDVIDNDERRKTEEKNNDDQDDLQFQLDDL